MNRLSKEKSSYLRHSAHQKIDWYPWSDEAFEKAKREDKPIFLSTGAIWCHWCHVMAKECFEDAEIIKLLNENFINIKLDRDERPDIDRRYQQAVAAMGSGGGWPLSIFLTPDKKPFWGGTYFPPEDSFGRPGFKKVLRAMTDFYKTKREELVDYSARLVKALKPKPLPSGEVKESMLDEATTNILSAFDPQNGGFGKSPKFPMPGAVEFLINRFFFTKKESIGHAVKKTLESMGKGGIHDQIGGGFHRYSVDEAWIIPHFEKMSDDNAWLLRNYLDAYFVFKNKYFKEIAEGIINFVRNVLSDPEGGFYASQDADIIPDDEGGYFTWRDEDFKKVLDGEEYKVLSLHFLHDRGSMQHDESKKVLFVSLEPEEIAEKLKMDLDKVEEIIKIGRKKLLMERRRRETPFVDKTFYTSLNGMLITAYLRAFRILRDKGLKDFALKSLNRIMVNRFINNELFRTEGVTAILDDYIYFIEALINAYEVTGEQSHLDRADRLMGLCIAKFWDKDEGGFFDTDKEIIGLRLKGIEDISHPSANSLGIFLLLKLFHMTNKTSYQQYADKALKTFSLKAKDLHVFASYYFSAMDAYFNMLGLTLETLPESKLAETALSSTISYMSIVYREDKGRVVPCFRDVCYEPIDNNDSLRAFLVGEDNHTEKAEN